MRQNILPVMVFAISNINMSTINTTYNVIKCRAAALKSTKEWT